MGTEIWPKKLLPLVLLCIRLSLEFTSFYVAARLHSCIPEEKYIRKQVDSHFKGDIM